jgi:hypothetical protein
MTSHSRNWSPSTMPSLPWDARLILLLASLLIDLGLHRTAMRLSMWWTRRVIFRSLSHLPVEALVELVGVVAKSTGSEEDRATATSHVEAILKGVRYAKRSAGLKDGDHA